MNIAICDDEPVVIEELHRLTEAYFFSAAIPAEIRDFYDAESLLSVGTKFDLLLLDCQLPGVDGVELARRIKERNVSSEIVFITAFSDYIFDSYDVQHLKYILKPVSEERLYRTFDDFFSSMNARKPVLVMADLSIPMNEIRYVVSKRSNTSVSANGTVYNSRKTLRDFEAELNPKLFKRISRGTIVGYSHIERHCDGVLTMYDGTKLTVSRRMRSDFLRGYTEFLNSSR